MIVNKRKKIKTVLPFFILALFTCLTIQFIGTASTYAAEITPNTQAPIITNLNGDSVTFTEDDPAVLIDSGSEAGVTDLDSVDFNGGNVTVSITANGQPGEDVLGIRNLGIGAGQIGIIGSNVTYGGINIGTFSGGTNGTNLVINLNSSATVNNVEALIRNLTYNNINGDSPSVLARTLSITVNDGDGGTSSPVNVTVNITNVNDAPQGKSTIPVQTVTATKTVSFMASDIAQDADCDPLTIVSIKTAPDNSVAAAALSGGAVTITGITAGTTSVAVTVSDGTSTADITVPVTVLSSIKVQEYNSNKSAATNTIYPVFKIFNNGSIPVNLSDLVIRYYYTIDGDKPQSLWCDLAAIYNPYTDITNNVTGQFKKMNPGTGGADYYLEIGFKSGTGSLNPGAYVDIATRFAKSDWTNYNQSDDYSFNSSSGSYCDWDKVAAYIGSKLVYGNPPLVNTTPAKLSTPAGLHWDAAVPGKAEWGVVNNAASYSVQLRKDGINFGTAMTVTAGTEWDFTAAITAAGSGIYTFTVAAIGDGTNYYNSDVSAVSSAYSHIVSGGSNGGSSSGGSSRIADRSSTVIAKSTDSATGKVINSLNVKVTAEANGTSTVELSSKDSIVFEGPNGIKSPVSDLAKLGFSPLDGNSKITFTPDGTIKVWNLSKGTKYSISVTYDLGNGLKIAIGTLSIKVCSDGNVSMAITLIDPYGVITDSKTGESINGAKVTLYYANTYRNKASEIIPDTSVTLPAIEGFKPNNNSNPQNSDSSGAYGFMVFPDTDYYIMAVKEGYETYRSPVISVGKEIVKWDFKMNKPIIGVNRMAGVTRIDTAIEIAKAEYTGKIKSVVLVASGSYSDALAGSMLAYKMNAPILLIGSTDEQKVIDYMKSNMESTGTVYILGGTGVVSSNVENKIADAGFTSIIRLSGDDRYETAVKVVESLSVKEGTPIVLVNGENYPDALSVSSAAAVMQMPVLLVGKDGMSDAVKNEVAKIKPSKIYAIGLEGAITDSVLNNASSVSGSGIVRIGGTDRYKTSVEVAKYFGLSGKGVCIATGNDFPDALAGSIYAANHNLPIVLAGNSLSDNEMNYLKTRMMTGAAIFGGEGAVNKNIEIKLSQLILK